MRQCLFLVVGVALAAPWVSSSRAGDNPADLGSECIDNACYACDKVHEQLDYLKCPGSMFYFSTEAIFLRREVTNTDFPATSFGVGGPVIARLQNLSFNIESGIRATAGYRCNPWWSVEYTYFGAIDWHSQFVANDPGGRLFGVLNRFGTAQQPNFPSPPFPATFGTGNNTTAQAGIYNSRLNNHEFNLIHDFVEFNLFGDTDVRSPRLSIAGLAGLRYLRLADNFRLVTSGDIIPSAGINDPAATADYRIDSKNDAFGGQIGLRMGLRLWDQLTLGTEYKFAVLGNGAEQTSNVLFLFTQPAPILGFLNTSRGDLRTSTLNHIRTYLSWDVTQYMTVRGGYELFWLNGRALAPDQVDPNVAQTNTIQPMLNDKGTTLFYGGFGGLEFRF
jgi:Putative beta barrel porin-7 (BBP7)